MPLDQNEIAEIKTAIEKGTDLPVHLKPLIDLGLNIKTPQQQRDYETNYHQTVIAPEVKKIHTMFEQDIFAVTGIQKDTNEKSFDYLKRAVPAKISSSVSAMESELKALKEQKPGTLSDADKARIKQLEDNIAEKDGEITKLKTAGQEREINYKLDNSIAKIEGKFKKDIPASILKDSIERRREQLLKNSRINEAGIHFVDADNKPIISKATAQLLTVDEVVADAFKDMFAEEVKQPGAGTNGGGGTPPPAGKVDTKTLEFPQEITTKVQLTEWLKKLGIPEGKEYNEVHERLGKGLKLR
jgi:hypothetical protein